MEVNFAMDTSTSKLVGVNVESCHRVAALMRTWVVPRDQEDSTLPGLSRHLIGNYYLFLVAICHQTSPRGVPPLEGTIDGRKLRGWDFLTAKFEASVRVHAQLLHPQYWSLMTAQDMSTLFHDPLIGARLSDPSGRSLLVRDMGREMSRRGWATADDIFRLCSGRVATGDPNLFGELSRFRAYDDPVRKKSIFFLSLMKNSNIWSYSDDSLLGAPVDYHEMRGHLRIGTVVVNDEILLSKLHRGEVVSAAEDVSLRSAVYEAILLLSELTGIRNPSQLHYLFWNVFRACCKRDETHCHSCPKDCALPDRYVPLAMHTHGPRRCPFSDVCASVNQSHKISEHVFDTDYY